MLDNDYKSYFDLMPCYLTVQNRDLRVIEANARFRKDFGEFEDRHCYQIYKQRAERCDHCPVERTFRDGNSHSSEELVKTLDGREVWVILYTTPIRNEAGEVVSVMEMSTDITDIKLLHKHLRESQEHHRLLFEEVPCYISIQDKGLRIVEANRLHREAFGTAYGSKCYKVLKHRDKECLPCIVRQTFEDGQAHVQEEVLTTRDHRRMNVLVHAAPFRNADGEIDRVIEMSTDITQIRQLQDKLTSVGLLISSISHGIKGLLNSLDGGIYLVDTGLKNNDRERIDRGWEMAARNVRRIRSMVQDILFYAKDREPEYETISARQFVEDFCNQVKERAKRLKIAFNYDIDPDAGDFEIDPQAVRSLILNLFENSIDACRVDSKKSDHLLSMTLKGAQDSVTITVSDNGIGMDQETREKAFSMFFSSKGAGGTGLGLFIANKIAQSHGGSIRIESEENEGCCFTVKLPRKRPDIVIEPDATIN